jgi:HAD superfamily hydrolase (TIGR01662 family)
MPKSPKLYLFDVDGTLVQPFTDNLLYNVANKLAELDGDGHILVPVTNQGGPACRHAGWGDDKYPTVTEVLRRLYSIEQKLVMLDFPYICWVYIDKRGNVHLPPVESQIDKATNNHVLSVDPGLDPNWRKPNPGMLLAAMRHYDIAASDTVYVGNGPEDAQAAEAAGVAYRHAGDFFMPEDLAEREAEEAEDALYDRLTAGMPENHKNALNI